MWLDAQVEQAPKGGTLYHYTDGNGLLGIVTNKNLWATRIQFLNDGSELEFAIREVAASVLPALRYRNPGVDNLLKYIETTDLLAHIYVASFTTDDDDLAQWRGYGRAGDSYSLGVSYEALATRVANRPLWRLGSCIYDRAQQEDLVKTALVDFCDAFDRGEVQLEPDADPDHVFDRAGFSVLLSVAPRIKHAAFRKEGEWRLYCMPSNSEVVKFRPGKHSIIPYQEFDLTPSPGEIVGQSIRIGPGAPDRNATQKALYSLWMQQRGFFAGSALEVQPSNIPYRDW